MKYKKVLRECKRYTARRVASTRCAAVSQGGGFLPWPGGGTYPHWGVPTPAGGYLPKVGIPHGLESRYPPQAGRLVPPPAGR